MTYLEQFIDFLRNVVRKMPKKLSEAANKVLPVMQHIGELLESNIAVDISILIGANFLRKEALELIERLIPIIEKIEDLDIKKGALSRLGGMLTKIEHGGEISTGKCVMCFEAVLNSSKS